MWIVEKVKAPPRTKPRAKPRARRRTKRRRRRCKKPLMWNPSIRVATAIGSGGVVGALDSCVPITGGFDWHGHHSWPKFAGGAVIQPLIGVRGAVHLGILHPALLAVLVATHGITGNLTNPANVRFIARLRTDLRFRARVTGEMTAFYLGFSATQCDPGIPAPTYELGILHTAATL